MKEGNDEEDTTKSKGGETMSKSKRRSRRRGEMTTMTTTSGEIKRHPNTSTTLLGGNANHDHNQQRGWKPRDRRGRGARQGGGKGGDVTWYLKKVCERARECVVENVPGTAFKVGHLWQQVRQPTHANAPSKPHHYCHCLTACQYPTASDASSILPCKQHNNPNGKHPAHHYPEGRRTTVHLLPFTTTSQWRQCIRVYCCILLRTVAHTDT